MNTLKNVIPGPGFKNELGMAAQLQKHLPYKNSHLLEYRLQNGYISQAVAAERAGIHTWEWMDIENNKVIPTEEQAQRICFLMLKDINEVFPRGVRITWPHRIRVTRYSKLLLLRAEAGMTQDELAKQVKEKLQRMKEHYDCPSLYRIKSVISDLEWNLIVDNNFINTQIIHRIARILGTTPAEVGGYGGNTQAGHQPQ